MGDYKMQISKTNKGIAHAACMFIMVFACVMPAAEEERKRGPHIEGGESGIEFMNRFDLNKDGKIDHEEWEAVKPSTVYRQKHWPEYNVNMDDYITLEEVPEKDGTSEAAPPEEGKKGPTAQQVAFVVKFDKDQDGKLSETEFTGNYFSVYDRNGDGYIEASEAPSGKTAY
jgi:Ca2+-binding EF-hand superfamily protein